jgi:protein-disulfide isomerase
MKRKLTIIGFMAMILSIALLLVQGESARTVRALEPEPAEMTDLNNLDQLKESFQRDRGSVRLVTLLSPVCPACRSGFTDMQKVLKAIPDERLRVYIVWLPMFPGDSRKLAQTRSDEFSDKRVSYYWDGEKIAGKAWQNVLGTKREAWDVYLLYGAESQWDKDPPTPDFWMHQLSGLS